MKLDKRLVQVRPLIVFEDDFAIVGDLRRVLTVLGDLLSHAFLKSIRPLSFDLLQHRDGRDTEALEWRRG